MGEVAYIGAPFEGMDVSMPSHLLGVTRAPYVRNFLVDNDRLALRGPLRWKATATGYLETDGDAITTDSHMFPVWTGQYVLLRTVNPDVFGERWWPHGAFEGPHPALKTTREPSYGRMAFWDPVTNTLTNHGATGDIGHAFGPHTAPYGDYIYSITTGDDTGSGNYFQYPPSSGRFHPEARLSRLARNPGESVSVQSTLPNTPRSGQGLATYANRLWYLGGVAADSAADTVASQEITNRSLQPNTLWYTNAITPNDPLLLTGWQTNGVSNKIVVGAETPADYGVALTAAAKYMVIHKKRSTWVLTGSGLDSFAIKEISSTVGLVDPRAKLAHEDVVYWVSREGLQAYDGATVVNLSEAIDPLLRPAVQTRSGADAESGSFVLLQALSNNYLLLQIGSHDLYDGGTEALDQSWLYHIPTGRWTVFYTSNYGTTAPVGTVRSGKSVYHMSTQHIHDATFVADPLMIGGDLRGNDLSPSDDLQSYPADCYLLPLRLGAPFSRGAVERYGAETIQEFRSGGTVGLLEMQLVRYTRRAEDGQEPTPDFLLTSAQSVPCDIINAEDTPEYRPCVHPFDDPFELTDVQIRVSRDWTEGVAGDPVVWMELLGTYLEWRPTHERLA